MPHPHIPDMTAYRDAVSEAATFVRNALGTTPVPPVALVLGTGLGALHDDIEVEVRLPYADIPGFPAATTSMHEGELLMGGLDATPVLAMNGRMHLYEGYTAHEVAFPVRVLGELGVQTLLLSNAAGGLNPQYATSDVVLITDHINEQGTNPLMGPNVEAWGPRFPDMSAPYDLELCARAREVALEQGVELHRGVYLAVPGPMLETRAEYRKMRDDGADLVGMSTVPEVIAAHHMGVRCLAVSVVTDMCLPDALEPATLDAIVAAANEARPQVRALFGQLVQRIGA
ncbi:MAG: purine-nucleoside phosphorylase [Longimonas sp.]|uniref:purine-nucleoside phosphorylase n=1 Tax=Longimonas sp. TaxID=2039626 RepID=UPI0039747FB2